MNRYREPVPYAYPTCLSSEFVSRVFTCSICCATPSATILFRRSLALCYNHWMRRRDALPVLPSPACRCTLSLSASSSACTCRRPCNSSRSAPAEPQLLQPSYSRASVADPLAASLFPRQNLQSCGDAPSLQVASCDTGCSEMAETGLLEHSGLRCARRQTHSTRSCSVYTAVPHPRPETCLVARRRGTVCH